MVALQTLGPGAKGAKHLHREVQGNSRGKLVKKRSAAFTFYFGAIPVSAVAGRPMGELGGSAAGKE